MAKTLSLKETVPVGPVSFFSPQPNLANLVSCFFQNGLKDAIFTAHTMLYGKPILKTTVDIADDLLKRSQQLAKREGSTLRAILEEGLRLVLKNRRRPASRAFRLPTFGKGGLSAEFSDADWEKIRATIYGDATHK